MALPHHNDDDTNTEADSPELPDFVTGLILLAFGSIVAFIFAMFIEYPFPSLVVLGVVGAIVLTIHAVAYTRAHIRWHNLPQKEREEYLECRKGYDEVVKGFDEVLKVAEEVLEEAKRSNVEATEQAKSDWGKVTKERGWGFLPREWRSH